MKAEDRPRFILALTTIADVFGRTLSLEAGEAWFQDLSPYPIDLVVEALDQYRATNNTGFMPVPGMIADIVNSRPRRTELRGLPDGERYPTKEEAKEILAKLREIVQDGLNKPWVTRGGPAKLRPRTSDPVAPGRHFAPGAESDKEGA